jgi:bacillolysin/neutral peptidase B
MLSPHPSSPLPCRAIPQPSCQNGKVGIEESSSVRTYNHKFREVVDDVPPYLDVNNNCLGECQQALNNARIVADFFQTNLPSESLRYISHINVAYYFDHMEQDWLRVKAFWSGSNGWAVFGRIDESNLGSYASSLTAIAHEFGHMLNEQRVNLTYKDQSGALDESYADIFAILVANREQPNDCNREEEWNWNIGEGFGYEHNSNSALRSLKGTMRDSDGDYYPQTMSDYKPYKTVHFNSCIHSRAVYELLIFPDHDHNYLFDVDSVVTLLYESLRKLKPQATFLDSCNAMDFYVMTQFESNPEKMRQVRDAIARVFDNVGVVQNPPSDSDGKF